MVAGLRDTMSAGKVVPHGGWSQRHNVCTLLPQRHISTTLQCLNVAHKTVLAFIIKTLVEINISPLRRKNIVLLSIACWEHSIACWELTRAALKRAQRPQFKDAQHPQF